MFEDNFDRGSDPAASNWRQASACPSPPTGSCWDGHNGNGVRSGGQVFLRNGLLVIRAEVKGSELYSGLVKESRGRTYGAYEFRIRTDDDPSGAMSGVALLWPSGGGAINGEQDMYETGRDHSTWSTFVHYSDGGAHKQVWHIHRKHSREWAIVRYEWTPSSLRVYRDGVLQKMWTSPQVIPDNLQTLSFQYDAFAASLAGPSELQIDWVRVYRYTA